MGWPLGRETYDHDGLVADYFLGTAWHVSSAGHSTPSRPSSVGRTRTRLLCGGSTRNWRPSTVRTETRDTTTLSRRGHSMA
jgi:hypothetical protein